MKHENKFPFMKRMADLEAPLRMRIELTRRCNLDCIHCKAVTYGDPSCEMTAKEIGGLLDEARALGTIDISISGGEVFARPDIEEVFAEIFKRDFRLHIQTNGAAMTASHLGILAANVKHILRLSFSLYSVEPQIHDAITRTPGSHEQTLQNIFAAKDAGIPVICFTLIMKENATNSEALKSFYENKGLDYRFNTFIIPREDGCMGPLSQRISDEEVRALPVDWRHYMNADAPESKLALQQDAPLSAICPAARFAVVTSVGDVTACSMLRESAGNIREKSFTEIWRNSPVLKKVREITVGQLECYSCARFPACKPCIGVALLEHGELFRRPSEICRLTEALMDRDKT